MEHAIAPFKGTGPPLPLCALRVRLFLLETASLLWMTSVGISIRHGPTCLAPPREKTLLINSPGPVQWTQAPVPGCARQSLGTWGLGKDFHPGRQCKQLLAEKSSLQEATFVLPLSLNQASHALSSPALAHLSNLLIIQ